MLVVSRKKNESLIINDDITIVIVEIRGDKVRLGVEAPKEVPVHRREVYDAIRGYSGSGWSTPVSAAEADAIAGRAQRAAAGADLLSAQAAVIDDAPQEQERDGLCCPQCQSDDVSVQRIKVAYKGAELVRWRECAACGNKFQTLERVADL
jgi:carbon storage regulator